MEKHFASLKLLDSDSDQMLTRSYSHSDLLSPGKIYLQQSYRSENPAGLVRQYSCEQIFDEATKTRQLKVSEAIHSGYNRSRNVWQTTVPYVNAFAINNWEFHKSNNVTRAPLATTEPCNEIEYMEVENLNNTSTQETESSSNCKILNTDVSDTTQQLPCIKLEKSEKKDGGKNEMDRTAKKDTNTYSDIKKKLRPLVPKTKASIKKERNMCCCNLLYLCLIPVAIGIISLVLNPVTYNVCYREFGFSNATHELEQKIYGQANAISQVTYALKQDIYHLKVICLVGGTGVGKSYTTEIIRKNFPVPERIFVYDLALGHIVDAKVLRSFDSYNLLIIENLKMKDLDFFVNIINVLKRSKDKCITVFAIFNVENVSNDLARNVDLVESSDRIVKALAGSKMDISVIPYQPLSGQALELCIMEAAAYSDLKLTQSQMNEIKDSLLFSNSGCKGAYAKVQVVGRM